MADNNYIVRENEKGSVNISEEVIATIATEAVREVEGVQGFASSLGGELADRLSKKASNRGVKITIEENNVTVDAYILVQYGTIIADVSKEAQQAVATGIESITGLAVQAVNITVCGIAFDKTK